jgi:hypothetical protein
MPQVPIVFYNINLVIQEFMVGCKCGLNSNLPIEHFEVHAFMSPTIGLHQSSHNMRANVYNQFGGLLSTQIQCSNFILVPTS